MLTAAQSHGQILRGFVEYGFDVAAFVRPIAKRLAGAPTACAPQIGFTRHDLKTIRDFGVQGMLSAASRSRICAVHQETSVDGSDDGDQTGLLGRGVPIFLVCRNDNDGT